MDEREELRRLAAQVRERARWLERGGVVGGKRGVLPRPGTGTGAGAGTGTGAGAGTGTPTRTPTGAGAVRLAVVREELGDCQRCKLAPKRKNLVFGVGDPDASLVFVGEAPGADEDASGEPFVGQAGQLLTKMIAAMGYGREQVYICNILKCRPPGNRNPEPDEVAACEPFLKQQLAAIRPRMIVALGKFAAQCLLRSDAPISALRGRFQSYEGIPLMPTFHPAYLLRSPEKKREVWADLQQVMAELKRLGL
jgi:DNA polymerase